eukprot:UN26802
MTFNSVYLESCKTKCTAIGDCVGLSFSMGGTCILYPTSFSVLNQWTCPVSGCSKSERSYKPSDCEWIGTAPACDFENTCPSSYPTTYGNPVVYKWNGIPYQRCGFCGSFGSPCTLGGQKGLCCHFVDCADTKCAPDGTDYDENFSCLKQLQSSSCVNVNNINDKPGFYTCSCVDSNDACLSSGQCVYEPACPASNGQPIPKPCPYFLTTRTEGFSRRLLPEKCPNYPES